MQSQMQNFNKPTISSFTNTTFNPQLNTTLNISSNVNSVQDIIPVALDDTSTMTPLTAQTTPLNMNENQTFNTPRQPMQDYYQVSHPSLLSHPQENDVKNEYSFFYTPCNDYQMYHIICKEISFSFESVSQLISNTDNNLIDNYVQSNNLYVFYYEQPEIKKIYQVTCEMVSHTFIFQFLNKIIYNIQFIKCEHQQQEFSRKHQENLKFHLKKDLIHYLVPKNIYGDNYNVHKRFIQDYCTYESMINSNSYMPNHYQQCNTNILPLDQSYTSQQDDNCQIASSNNYGTSN